MEIPHRSHHHHHSSRDFIFLLADSPEILRLLHFLIYPSTHLSILHWMSFKCEEEELLVVQQASLSRSCTKISFHGNQVSGSDENSRAKVGSPAIERNKDGNFLCVVSWRVGVSENWQRKRSKARKLNKLKNCTRAETLLAFPFVKGLSAMSFIPSIHPGQQI